MNYYVLYCQTVKTEKVCTRLNRNKNIKAFIPKMEKYIHSKDETVLQVMFPGYLFIQTEMNQLDFTTFLLNMKEDRNGIIRELKKADVSAINKEELNLLKTLLNDKAILTMSRGYKENGITIVTEGPLCSLQEHIVAVDRKDRLAILNIEFLNRRIRAGIQVK